MKHRLVPTFGTTLLAVLLAAGCTTGASDTGDGTTQGAHVSRVKLYASTEQLTGDSDAVVVATVTGSRLARDITPDTEFTISSLLVKRVVVGETPPAETLQVRQLGSSDQAPPTPLLQVGQTYLLFLTASGLSGELASQYYVTGGNAGIYRQTGSAPTSKSAAPGEGFEQVDAHEGDALPILITPTDLEQLP